MIRKILATIATGLLLCPVGYAQEKISITSVSVSPQGIEQPFSTVQKITDGEMNGEHAIFHTLWSGIPKQDVTIEASLAGKGKCLDRIKLFPRTMGINGIIRTAQVWVMQGGKYTKVADIDAAADHTPLSIDLDTPILNPERVKIVVQDAYASYRDAADGKYFVSLAELECHQIPADAPTGARLQEDSQVFASEGTALAPGVTRKRIARMKTGVLRDLATRIARKSYTPEQLYVSIAPEMNPRTLGQMMRIGDGFSNLEGITGVVLPKGENVIFVGDTHGAEVSLIIPDWTRRAPDSAGREILIVDESTGKYYTLIDESAKHDPTQDPAGWGLHKQTYKLKEGVNLVDLPKEGLAYIGYYVDDKPEEHAPIMVHFPTGRVNGYFDPAQGHDDKYFDALLDAAIYPIMDMRGKHVQVAFPVDSLKSLTRGRGSELLHNFDSIVALQRHFIGWDKEGFQPTNRVLARINYHYYMFRDADGVAYIDWAMPMVANPSSIIKGDPCWGFSHELGHVLQMRPQMTWGGMTEVSNNIMTLYSTTMLGNRSRLSAEGTYAKARATILDKGISYMDFPGEMRDANQYGGTDNTDVFQRLVPFWQLHLYFKEQGYPDFYADLMTALRRQEPLGDGDPSKDYLNMLEFCRMACQVSQTDLTEFFERWGFFYVGEVDVMDYGYYKYNVTQEDVDRTKKAIADMNLPKPVKDITLMED